ncbi:hypothetical protein Tco_1507125 [Tanacetum coccineum]
MPVILIPLRRYHFGGVTACHGIHRSQRGPIFQRISIYGDLGCMALRGHPSPRYSAWPENRKLPEQSHHLTYLLPFVSGACFYPEFFASEMMRWGECWMMMMLGRGGAEILAPADPIAVAYSADHGTHTLVIALRLGCPFRHHAPAPCLSRGSLHGELLLALNTTPPPSTSLSDLMPLRQIPSPPLPIHSTTTTMALYIC